MPETILKGTEPRPKHALMGDEQPENKIEILRKKKTLDVWDEKNFKALDPDVKNPAQP